jgi:hypothetical protein
MTDAATQPVYAHLEQAVQFLAGQAAAPDAAAVVEDMRSLEKQSKSAKPAYSYTQLLGTWRLGFITGTTRSRQKAGSILGAGRFIPKLFNISLTYTLDEASEGDRGRVDNTVRFGLVRFTVTGPTQLHPRHILAFDFTQLHWAIAGISLYNGYIRDGQAREASFYRRSVKDQAFFTYFYVSDRYIAARGRGGGLALWTKVTT